MPARSPAPRSAPFKPAPAAESTRPAARTRADKPREPLLSTESSPYYQIWVLTNLTGKPFGALFGERSELNLTEWRILLTLADKPDLTAQGLSYGRLTAQELQTLRRLLGKLSARARIDPIAQKP